jgi:uncharacterized membrane protein
MTSLDETRTARKQGRSFLPSALIGGVFLVVAIVFAASSSWFTIFLTVHVVFVVIWIGGGMLLTVLALLAERSRDGEQLASIARMAAFAGERIFAPSAIVVLAMGIAMVLNTHYGFDHFWVFFGLLGFLTTFLTGVGVLSPMSKQVATLVEEKGATAPETQAAIAKILLVARADVALLLLVIVDMITKPFS